MSYRGGGREGRGGRRGERGGGEVCSWCIPYSDLFSRDLIIIAQNFAHL